MSYKALILLGLMAGSLAPAQIVAPRFPNPAYFRHHFQTPDTRVQLEPPVRLQDFVAGGKLELSLRAYLELVMANNTDIAVQRLTLEIPRNTIMRQYGAFDPQFVAAINGSRAKDASTTALAGASLLNTLNQSTNLGYTQTFENGTSFNTGFLGSKQSSNNSFSTFNPSFLAQWTMGFTQPLLRNRGFGVMRLPIMSARSQLRKSEYDLRDTVMTLIQQAESAYWDVIESRERLRVQQEYLKLSAEALKRSERELELGAMSPLDIYQPQQQYAAAEIQVSQQGFQLMQREDILRRFLGADLDRDVRKLPVVLTETVMPPAEESPVDRDSAVERALLARPDLKSAVQSLDIDDLSIRSSTNLLRPDVSLTGTYIPKGRGGTLTQKTNVFSDSTGDASQIVKIIPGGFGDAMSQMFGFTVPTYQFGLTMRFPIRDRRATADLANALVQKKLDSLRVRSVQQRIRQDVLNAVTDLESAKAGVKLAAVSRDFAKKQADAEQKKYDLGTNVIYFVLQAQTNLANAEAELVRQSVQYRRSKLNLFRFTGELLDERGILLK